MNPGAYSFKRRTYRKIKQQKPKSNTHSLLSICVPTGTITHYLIFLFLIIFVNYETIVTPQFNISWYGCLISIEDGFCDWLFSFFSSHSLGWCGFWQFVSISRCETRNTRYRNSFEQSNMIINHDLESVWKWFLISAMACFFQLIFYFLRSCLFFYFFSILFQPIYQIELCIQILHCLSISDLFHLSFPLDQCSSVVSILFIDRMSSMPLFPRLLIAAIRYHNIG